MYPVDLYQLTKNISKYTKKGIRVLTLATSENKSINSFYNFCLVGIVLIADEVRPEAIKGVKLVKQAGIQTVMITGDNIDTATTIAKEVGIVEEKDTSDEQKLIKEINAGIYCFDIEALLDALKEIKPNNAQGEYYLTDVIEIMNKKGLKTGAVVVEDNTEILGVNDRVQLELLTKVLQMRINTEFMKKGVTIEDINTTYIYDDVEIGMDTVIHPNTMSKSGVVFGEDCEIGPNAYIREGCRLANKVKIGSFVEIKKAIIGEGTKVPHLSYMGDCEIGEKCNIGCGTITCNYDGLHKSKTIIGNHSFIGSNTNLVAPVTLGDNTFVAAGSTITDDVPAHALAIARGRQVNKEGWNKNN